MSRSSKGRWPGRGSWPGSRAPGSPPLRRRRPGTGWRGGRCPRARDDRAARGWAGRVRVRRDRWGVPHIEADAPRRSPLRPGLLPRPGPALADGLLPPRGRGAGRRDGGRGGAAGRPADADARHPPRRRARGGGARPRAARRCWSASAPASTPPPRRPRRCPSRCSCCASSSSPGAGRHPQPRQAARLRPLDQLGAGAAARRHGARAGPGADRAAGPDLSRRQPDRQPGSRGAATGWRSSSRSTRCGARSGSPPRPAAPTTGPSPAPLSATGSPLIAGDPHLPPSMPGIWYQVGLRHGERFVRGASLPGMPGIYMGQNNDVCWTITNVMADVQDLFIERVEGERYLSKTSGGRCEIVREEIAVKGRDRAGRPRGARHPPRPDRQRGARRRRGRAAGAALADARRTDRLRRHVRAARDRLRRRSWSRSSRATPRRPRT